MAINNKLPLHTRLGTYFTVLIVVLVCFLLLRNCVNAVYYGAVTNDKDLSRYYGFGFEVGSKQIEITGSQPEESITNPLLLKEYRKGFREGRDSIRNKMKREKNEKN